jgi:hypothetical protein
VSAKAIRRMHAAGKLPNPVLIGSRSLRWLRATLVEWLALGCPDRHTFEAVRRNGRKSVTKEWSPQHGTNVRTGSVDHAGIIVDARCNTFGLSK